MSLKPRRALASHSASNMTDIERFTTIPTRGRSLEDLRGQIGALLSKPEAGRA